ncbi:MAG TPA: universal stress protein [Rhizomicrobium sp.]|nr:universal stress protein [Rhizomicrobium sp.]
MKHILASLSGMPGDHAVLRTAALVAKAHDAHIDALFVYAGLQSIREMTGLKAVGDPLAAISGEFSREEAERRHHAHAVFDEMSLRLGLPIADAPRPDLTGPSIARVDVDSLALAEVARRARFYDLTVMAREPTMLPSRVTDVVMASGRPLLLAPQGPRQELGTNIAIAWKPCAESARAVSMAAPFLARTSRVTLIVMPEGGASQSDTIAAARPLRECLEWRGIQAQILAVDPGPEPGLALREAVYAQECDLLVMGAYGHSRMREAVLGGVTQAVLEECEIPVLMAH